MRKSGFIFTMWLSVLVGGTALAARFAQDPFADAEVVPANVTAYFSITEAGHLIRDLRESPMGEGLEIFLLETSPGREVAAYLREVGMNPSGLISMLTAQGATIVLLAEEEPHRRHRSRKEEADEFEGKNAGPPSVPPWILVARTSEAQYKKLHQGLETRVGEWVGSIPISNVKGNEIHLAFKKDRVYVAGKSAKPALVEMLQGLAHADTLAHDKAFAEATKLGPGEIGFFSRREGRSHTMITAGIGKVEDDGLSLRIRSDRTPRGKDRRTDPRDWEPEAIDAALVTVMDADVALVKVERVDPPRSDRRMRTEIELFPVPNPERAGTDVLENIGPTLFTVMRTVERSDPAGLVMWIEPQVSIGVELGDTVSGSAALDRFMNEQISRLADWREIALPDMANTMRQSDPHLVRFVILDNHSMPMERFGLEGRWPREWAWSTTTGQFGEWWVCSTDRGMLNDLDSALIEHRPNRDRKELLSQGVLRGHPISVMLSSWPGVSDENRDCEVEGLFAWKELLSHVQVVKWTSTRPEEGIREMQVEIEWQ